MELLEEHGPCAGSRDCKQPDDPAHEQQATVVHSPAVSRSASSWPSKQHQLSAAAELEHTSGRTLVEALGGELVSLGGVQQDLLAV